MDSFDGSNGKADFKTAGEFGYFSGHKGGVAPGGLDIGQLDTFLWYNRNHLAPFRENANRRILNAAGQKYGGNGQHKARPVNLTALNTSILGHRLMPAAPKTLWTTFNSDYEHSALEMEGALNKWIEVTDAGKALSEAVMNAIYGGIGIVQTGIRPYSSQVDPGQVRINPVSLDDWVMDMMAERIEDCTLFGHRYRALLSEVQQDQSIPIEVRRNLHPTPSYQRTDQGIDRASRASRPDSFWYTEFAPHVELWQIYFPQNRRLQTYLGAPLGGGMVIAGQPIRDVQWEGPAMGPYDILELMPLPSNPIGMSPVQQWEDFDDAINVAARKVIYDIKQFKKIAVFMRGNSDSKIVSQTPHGEAAGVDSPDTFREVELCAPSEVMVNSIPTLRGLANLFSGNLDQVGGLQQQAGTATQERILNESADVVINAMQKRVKKWTSKVLRHAAGWLFTDPELNLTATSRIAGTDATVQFQMTPERVLGVMNDYDVAIAPYTEADLSPSDRLQQLIGLINTVILPLSGPMQSQGIQPDFQYLVQEISRLANAPEIAKFLPVVGPPGPETAGIGSQPAQPQPTPQPGPQTTQSSAQDFAHQLSRQSLSSPIGAGPM